MIRSRNTVEALVMGIQSEFLEIPGLRLTLPQATRRFGLDKTTCQAILNALVDLGVLAVTDGDGFTRPFSERIDQGRRAATGFRRRPLGASDISRVAGTAA